MKTLILDAEARTAITQHISQPSVGTNEIIVQVEAIAFNPVDPLYVGHPLARSGRTIGSGFAGIASSIGRIVPTTGGPKVSDRVSGFLQGVCSVNERPGAFADYLAIPWDLVSKVPSTVGIERAAGISLVALTAALGIWYRPGLEAPFCYGRQSALDEHPEWVWSELKAKSDEDVLNFFIYGASTSIGLFAAQMVRLSAKITGKKTRLFGAASKARWEMLKADPYRYDHLVEYCDANWPAQVRELSDGVGMHYLYDCISESSSVERTSSTLAPNRR